MCSSWRRLCAGTSSLRSPGRLISARLLLARPLLPLGTCRLSCPALAAVACTVTGDFQAPSRPGVWGPLLAGGLLVSGERGMHGQ